MSEPTPAQRLRALHALYPIHRTLDFPFEELTCETQRTVDRIARLIAEIEDPIRELHKPYGIYDECGHEHTQEELDDPDSPVVEVDEIGLTCDTGLMYRVCTHCCLTGRDFYDYQHEECATNHTHGMDEPICATIAALEKRDAPVNQ